jgi:hypothetical protein
MARDDGILDLDYQGSPWERSLKFFSTANAKYNPKTVIYYNSADKVLKIEETLYPGTANEHTYTQHFYYSDVTNSGIDHTMTIHPWV